MNIITNVLPAPVDFAVYRYKHLYIVQGQDVLVVTPSGVTRQHLEFSPTTFASYSGVVAFKGAAGAAQFIGSELSQQYVGAGEYSLPLAELVRDNVTLTPHGVWKGKDCMGLPLELHGKVSHAPLHGISYYDPLLGALVEPDQLMVFLRDQAQFAHLNGTVGSLLYCELDSLSSSGLLVPYSYPQQNLHGAGMHGGFVFTPDNGRSWRKRKLGGFGVLTEKAVLSVNQDCGVQVVTGSFT